MFGWACWRFNIAVQVQQQEQEVFYTINVDPRGHRYERTAFTWPKHFCNSNLEVTAGAEVPPHHQLDPRGHRYGTLLICNPVINAKHVQRQEEVFYTMYVDPRGHRYKYPKGTVTTV